MRVSTSALVCLTAALAACGGSDSRQATDSATAAGNATATPSAATTAAATPAVSLSSMTGMWHGRSMQGEDTTKATRWTLDATSDTTKWTLTFANGTKVPVRLVSTGGDSIVSEMGPYKSASLKGQNVNARQVAHVRGDSMSGTFEMRPTSKPDSVIRGRFDATRMK